MDRPRLIKGLRITVSSVCLIVCVFLVVLWVRSHYAGDVVGGRISATQDTSKTSTLGRIYAMQVISIISDQGRLVLSVTNTTGLLVKKWHIQSYEPRKGQGRTSRLPWEVGTSSTGWYVLLSHWLFVFVTATIAAVPWIHWSKRFSLRTLLIATMLVAVLLGVVVWLSS